MEGFANMMPPQVNAVRDGKDVSFDAIDLCVGDVIKLEYDPTRPNKRPHISKQPRFFGLSRISTCVHQPFLHAFPARRMGQKIAADVRMLQVRMDPGSSFHSQTATRALHSSRFHPKIQVHAHPGYCRLQTLRWNNHH